MGDALEASRRDATDLTHRQVLLEKVRASKKTYLAAGVLNLPVFWLVYSTWGLERIPHIAGVVLLALSPAILKHVRARRGLRGLGAGPEVP